MKTVLKIALCGGLETTFSSCLVMQATIVTDLKQANNKSLINQAYKTSKLRSVEFTRYGFSLLKIPMRQTSQ